MKTTVKACILVTLGSLLPVGAQVSDTTSKSKVTESSDGKVTEKTTTTTTTFNPESRQKVVKYFDTYKSNPNGLPPGWTSKIKVKDMPTAWKTSRITPGLVLQEKERLHLVDAPAELISVLPPVTGDVRYYVAGSNVIAVDRSYRVVDSIQIPSIKIDADQ